MTRRVLEAAVLGLACLAGLGSPSPSFADGAGLPPNPFARLPDRIRLGKMVRVPGATVLPLRLETAHQSDLAAKVGLRGADTHILALPAPAGEMHVRIANRGTLPLEIPPGETLLSPVGPSRSVDRTVWLPPGAAAFVPVVHADTLPPPGPYLCRGLGLTPFELQHLRAGTWDERVRERNRRFGVDPKRADDAAAAYATEAFEGAAQPWRKALDGLADGVSVVGVAVFDARGLFMARLETDAERFAQGWPGLLAGIAMDGILRDDPRAPWPEHESEVRQEARRTFTALSATTWQSRPTFGLGTEYRFGLEDATGAWEGLALDEKPVALTLLREPPPRPGVTPPPQPPPPEDTTPDPGPVDRKPRPSAFEERWRDRRDDLGPGGARR